MIRLWSTGGCHFAAEMGFEGGRRARFVSEGTRPSGPEF